MTAIVIPKYVRLPGSVLAVGAVLLATMGRAQSALQNSDPARHVLADQPKETGFPKSNEPTGVAADLLFHEGFEDDRLMERGWYDFTKVDIARIQSSTRTPSTAPYAGAASIAYHWKPNTTNPHNSSGMRRLFQPTDTVYLRCYLKLSKGWKWTGRDYHPHLMHFMTTENGPYHGPAASHLTVYIEPQEGKLRLAAQDIQNRDQPHGLTQGPLRGGYNGKMYDSKQQLFTPESLDQWHCVEAFYKLNSLNLERDTANADGIVRAWFDGKLVVDHTNVILRSPDFPKMKFNQFLLLPYFGPGLLPQEQSLWIDELVVATKRLEP
jgi:hypothetical protein